MDTTNVKVRSLFGTDRQFVIPLFQRHYVWDREEQWEPLWEDMREKTHQRLLEHYEEQFTHFTGAIVIQQKQTSTNEVEKYEIIDGQQRLTTFQIILCALRDVCNSYQSNQFEKIKAEADRHVRNQGMLLDSEDEQYKLVPTEFDRSAFISLVDQRIDDSNGRIRDTYDYFKYEIEGYVNRDEDKMLALLRAILNDFGFVEISLHPHDEPERIFESLNARAKSLLQFDLLRNNLFLRARIEDDRDKLYSKYWKHFETRYWDEPVSVGRTKITLSELFFQHFLTAKLSEEDITPLYSAYQRGRLIDKNSVENELIELKKYSAIYREMTDCSPDSEIGRWMSVYETFGIATLRPLLLFLINELEVFGSDLSKVLEIMESYTMRRLVCFRQGVRGYTKLICRLIQSLQERQFDLGYFIKLLSDEMSNTTRWPTDSEIKDALALAGDNQSINPQIIRYVLYRIELMKRQKDSFREKNQLIFDNKLSLEHIMPEAWKKTWPLPLLVDDKRLSYNLIYYKDLFTPKYKRKNEDWEIEPTEEGLARDSYQMPFFVARDRDQYLQSIGNLTLVTSKLNSKMSNNPFVEKKVALNNHSDLRLNKEICDNNTWDIGQIQGRANELVSAFCEIWPSAEDFAKDFPYNEQINAQQDESSHQDLHPDEITHGPSPVSPLSIGAATRQSYPLTVTIPDKNLRICLRTGMATLIKVIEELGIENVRALGIMSYGIPLVAIKNYDAPHQTKVGRYYIAGNSPTSAKAEQIKVTGRKLDIQLDVKQNNVE